MTDSSRRLSYRLLAVGAFCLLSVAIFWAAFELGGSRMAAVAESRITALETQRLDLVEDNEKLRKRLSASERERVIIERSRQIDQETIRALKDQVKSGQDVHLLLRREVSYLKRLVRDGGKGAVQVRDLYLTPGSMPTKFHYSFTIVQIIQGVDQASGEVSLAIQGLDDGKAVTLRLQELPSAQPVQLTMDLEHFQTLQGTFEIPAGFEPKAVIISIEPNSESLLPTSEVFPWVAALR